jgi:hypothetical protein
MKANIKFGSERRRYRDELVLAVVVVAGITAAMIFDFVMA